MGKVKSTPYASTVADAVGDAWSELEGLAEECREIVDNASDGLRETQRIQTLDETASNLEGLSEPTVPDWFGPTKVSYPRWESARKGRGLSRADRCGQACVILDALVEVIEHEIEDADSDKKDALEALRDELDALKGEAEGCEFPGMYG